MKDLWILIRHLPTSEDELDIYSDPDHSVPLLPIDDQQLDLLVAAVTSVVHVSPVVIASYNNRGTETAERFASRLPPHTEPVVTFDHRLVNIRQACWYGKSNDEVADSELYRTWHDEPERAVFPGGETLGQVAQRVREFAEEYAQDSRPIVVISHTTPLQVLACELLGLPMSKIWMFYFAPYRASMIYGGRIISLNSRGTFLFDPRTIRE